MHSIAVYQEISATVISATAGGKDLVASSVSGPPIYKRAIFKAKQASFLILIFDILFTDKLDQVVEVLQGKWRHEAPVTLEEVFTSEDSQDVHHDTCYCSLTTFYRFQITGPAFGLIYYWTAGTCSSKIPHWRPGNLIYNEFLWVCRVQIWLLIISTPLKRELNPSTLIRLCNMHKRYRLAGDLSYFVTILLSNAEKRDVVLIQRKRAIHTKSILHGKHASSED